VTGSLEKELRRVYDRKQTVYFAIAWLLTAAYLIFILVYVLWGDVLSTLLWLKPDVMGNFFAGIFAPLAFLWLVIGYYQQKLELSQNTQTLAAQLSEMKASVEQQTRQTASIESNENLAKREIVLKIVDLYYNRLHTKAEIIYERMYGALVSDIHDRYKKGDRDVLFNQLWQSSINSNEMISKVRAVVNQGVDCEKAYLTFIIEYENFIDELQLLDSTKQYLFFIRHGGMRGVYELFIEALDDGLRDKLDKMKLEAGLKGGQAL
jgi:hypothetical protein